jgi:uncharacterized protein
MKRFLIRTAKVLSFLLLLGVLGGWYAVENVLPYSPIKPFRTRGATLGWELPLGTDPAGYGLKADQFSIRTSDGLRLRCIYIPTGFDTAGTTLILIHGIGGCKEHFLPAAKRLTESGLNVVLFDLRAHGESEGEYCTFGYKEKSDISVLIDTLQRRYPGQRLGILGNSLGGAIALQALAAEPRLQFGIIESTFHDLENVVAEYGKHMFGFKSMWLSHHTLERSAVIADFPAFDIKPFMAARQIHQPVFMAHGDADQNIPLAFGRINYENLASTRKEWHTVHGAGHMGLWAVGGAEYYDSMIRFIKKGTKEQREEQRNRGNRGQ